MSAATRRRVVITGIGIKAPTGLDIKSSWRSAVNGLSGIGRVSLLDVETSPAKIAGEVKGFEPSQYMNVKDTRRTSRFVQLGLASAIDALDDSGMDLSGELVLRSGCILGVGLGGLAEIEKNALLLEEKGNRRISPFFIPYAIPNMASGLVSLRLGLKGPNLCIATACSSASHAIGEGAQWIRSGKADVMVCGGAEAVVTPLGMAGFAALRALTLNDDPNTASRPFDRLRDGFVMGEGAAILILEELELAKSRGAQIYGELVGYGVSGDASHITAPAPDGEGAQRAMSMALDDAKLNPTDVSYINAHGTSTQLNDSCETAAIHKVFGDSAYSIPVSSTKGVTGHCLGATGAIEAVYSLLAIRDNLMPPTINYEEPDPLCDLDYIPNEARESQVDVVLSNSFGFGGTNCSLAFRDY
ncbi:MAG: beta-ketoacyl-[acyl-carrier-protein] synthase II [Zetaproteobacteria bacterium]|nr:beta-ketoacyl-[acyl-carrier-protein] synthase II [Pseudobdellovibrionaceae bacterium]